MVFIYFALLAMNPEKLKDPSSKLSPFGKIDPAMMISNKHRGPLDQDLSTTSLIDVSLSYKRTKVHVSMEKGERGF